LSQISTKSFGGWGFSFTPDTTGGVYSASPDPLTVFRRPAYKGRKGGEGEMGGK